VRTTTAGLGHELRIRTRYYDADVPMWLDEVASPGAWKADFLGDEAREVVRALGAWVVVFRREGASEEDDDYVGGVLAAVRQVVERAHGGDGGLWDGVCLAVGMPTSTVGAKAGRGGLRERTPEEWEDLCGEYGFEYVAGDDVAVGRSAEGDLSGVARLREALEANDWSGGGDEDELEDEFLFDGDGEGDGEDPGFGLERRELEEEFAGLRTGGGVEEDDVDEPMQVEELEAMMLKVQATRGEFFASGLQQSLTNALDRPECSSPYTRAAQGSSKNGQGPVEERLR